MKKNTFENSCAEEWCPAWHSIFIAIVNYFFMHAVSKNHYGEQRMKTFFYESSENINHFAKYEMSATLTGKYIPTPCSIHTIAQKRFCSNFCCNGSFLYFFIFSSSSHLMRWILSGKPISQSSRFLEYSWLSCGSCKKQWKNETCWHANFYDVCDETNRIMIRPPLNLLQDTLPADCWQRIFNRMDERSRQEASQKDNSLWTWISGIKNKWIGIHQGP